MPKELIAVCEEDQIAGGVGVDEAEFFTDASSASVGTAAPTSRSAVLVASAAGVVMVVDVAVAVVPSNWESASVNEARVRSVTRGVTSSTAARTHCASESPQADFATAPVFCHRERKCCSVRRFSRC